ncbi:MAG TPA: DUF5069 domain-containing protein [Candidatus Binatia bacterium]|nr:DUF5069 domain-containing protein [Candidatus Binatia bacterium]
MKLPGPRETLAGCVWLPRILAKARGLMRGDLPPDYQARFGSPTGVDGIFMAHFHLTRDDILVAAARPDAEVAAWFSSHTNPTQIAEWNRIALNLGRSGFPMAERFSLALSTTYRHVDPRGKTTVFEILEADEKNV